MKKLFIGHSPLTSFAGYIVAALIVIRDMNAAGVYPHWQSYILPVAIALFGRLAADDSYRRPPSMPPAYQESAEPVVAQSDNFLRRGKTHSQLRARNGRFYHATA